MLVCRAKSVASFDLDQFRHNYDLNSGIFLEDAKLQYLKLLRIWIDATSSLAKRGEIRNACFPIIQSSGVGKTKLVKQLPLDKENPYWLLHVVCKDAQGMKQSPIVQKLHKEWRQLKLESKVELSDGLLNKINAIHGKRLKNRQLALNDLNQDDVMLEHLADHAVRLIKRMIYYLIVKQDEGKTEADVAKLFNFAEKKLDADQVNKIWQEIVDDPAYDATPLDESTLFSRLKNPKVVICFDEASGLFDSNEVNFSGSMVMRAFRRASCHIANALEHNEKATFAMVFMDTNANVGNFLRPHFMDPSGIRSDALGLEIGPAMVAFPFIMTKNLKIRDLIAAQLENPVPLLKYRTAEGLKRTIIPKTLRESKTSNDNIQAGGKLAVIVQKDCGESAEIGSTDSVANQNEAEKKEKRGQVINDGVDDKNEQDEEFEENEEDEQEIDVGVGDENEKDEEIEEDEESEQDEENEEEESRIDLVDRRVNEHLELLIGAGRPRWSVSVYFETMDKYVGNAKKYLRCEARQSFDSLNEGLSSFTIDVDLLALISIRVQANVPARTQIPAMMVASSFAILNTVSRDHSLVFSQYLAEPILAAAASSLFKDPAIVEAALKQLIRMLSYYGPETGARGELIFMMMALASIDQITGHQPYYSVPFPTFLARCMGVGEELISESIPSWLTKSLVNVTQFVYADFTSFDWAKVEKGRIYAVGLIPSTSNNKAYDILIPFEDEDGNCAVLLLQIKNHAELSPNAIGKAREKLIESSRYIEQKRLEYLGVNDGKMRVFPILASLDQGKENRPLPLKRKSSSSEPSGSFFSFPYHDNYEMEWKSLPLELTKDNTWGHQAEFINALSLLSDKSKLQVKEWREISTNYPRPKSNWNPVKLEPFVNELIDI